MTEVSLSLPDEKVQRSIGNYMNIKVSERQSTLITELICVLWRIVK